MVFQLYRCYEKVLTIYDDHKIAILTKTTVFVMEKMKLSSEP